MCSEGLRKKLNQPGPTVPQDIDGKQSTQAAFNAIGDPVFVLDMAGRYVDVNNAACRCLGFSREELLNMTPVDLDLPETAFDVPRKLELIKSKGQLVFESDKMCKNGQVLHMEITAGLANLNGQDVIVSIARNITSRKQAENRLAYQKEYFEALFRSSTDAIISLDHNHLVVDINPRFEQLFGYTVDELAGHNVDDFINPDGFEDECRILTTDVLEGKSISKETVRRRKDGSIIHVLVRGTPILMENKIIGVLGIYTDITARITANKKLMEAHKLQQDIIDFLPDATFVVNREGSVIAWNRAMEKISGVKKEAVIGLGSNVYSVPFYGKNRPVLLDYLLTRDDNIIKDYQNFKQVGNKIFAETFAPSAYQGRGAYLWITASPLFDREGNLTGAIESIRDMTEQKEREQRLEFLSWHDQLTGMYNRTFFEQKLENIDIIENLPLTIITCDVDGLKLVNDTMGHAAGDKMLRSAAEVIKKSIRSIDIAARLGGDEFAVLLTRTDHATGSMVCRRIKKAIEQHNLAGDMPLSISIGMASTYEIDTGVTALVKEADNKMYQDKLLHSKSARNTVVQALLTALEKRNLITEGHNNRVTELALKLGKVLKLPEDRLSGLQLLARFHDIGMVGVTDSILNKPGPLTKDEISSMRMHCEIGHRIAIASPDLAHIAEFILKHHEWWNGEGYPMGLKKYEIPMECRIFAIVEAYDAMTSERPYRKIISPQQALDELLRCAGTQFDPHLLAEFINTLDEHS